MPTGYTAAVADGTITELTPFAMQLARGMGATVMMRDEPWDTPIPERFEPSAYNADRLAEACAERDRLYAMTDSEAEKAALVEYEEDCAARDKYFADKRAQRERYDAMIAKVREWQGAPEGIKEFGLEQLERGREFDCAEPFTYWKDIELLSGADWRRTQIEKVQKDIEYHTVEDAKERARTEGRNAWLAQLRASLEAA
jgi:hypothetical protein